MSRNLEAGKLIWMLPEQQLDADVGVYLVCPPVRHATTAADTLRQWVEARFAAGSS